MTGMRWTVAAAVLLAGCAASSPHRSSGSSVVPSTSATTAAPEPEPSGRYGAASLVIDGQPQSILGPISLDFGDQLQVGAPCNWTGPVPWSISDRHLDAPPVPRTFVGCEGALQEGALLDLLAERPMVTVDDDRVVIEGSRTRLVLTKDLPSVRLVGTWDIDGSDLELRISGQTWLEGCLSWLAPSTLDGTTLTITEVLRDAATACTDPAQEAAAAAMAERLVGTFTVVQEPFRLELRRPDGSVAVSATPAG